MVQLTIEIPEELAFKLQPMQNRMTEIIELGLQAVQPIHYGLYNEVIEFLVNGPLPQDILAFQPSKKSIERVTMLLNKNSTQGLTPSENNELDTYQQLDHFMTLIKAKARLQITQSS